MRRTTTISGTWLSGNFVRATLQPSGWPYFSQSFSLVNPILNFFNRLDSIEYAIMPDEICDSILMNLALKEKSGENIAKNLPSGAPVKTSNAFCNSWVLFLHLTHLIIFLSFNVSSSDSISSYINMSLPITIAFSVLHRTWAVSWLLQSSENLPGREKCRSASCLEDWLQLLRMHLSELLPAQASVT